MPFSIIRNDITKIKADAIVNTANPEPIVGSGTDSAIYAAAGKERLLAERKKIGSIEPGCVVSTQAFGLSAKYIIHTVGPVWVDGSHGERDTLRSCYQKSLALAAELKCTSIAFPLIATGVYGFPRDEALNIALSEIGRFLLTHEMQVTLVVFDMNTVRLSEDIMGGIEQFIDEHAAQAILEEEYDAGYAYELRRRMQWRRQQAAMNSAHVELEPVPTIPEPSPLSELSEGDLDDVLGAAGKSFQQRLFELIDLSGLDDVTVCKKANIDRKVFSRIRCKPDYKPTKKTAVAFAVALRLDLPTTRDLLARAELALSPSSRFDLIVSYFITHRIYDIFEINAALFKYGQPILGE